MFRRNNSGQRHSTADLAGNREPEYSDSTEVTIGQSRIQDSETIELPAVSSQDTDQHEVYYGSLFDEDAAQDLRLHWDELQTGFVDDPRRSVEEADHLVATTLKEIANAFSQERARLEHQWDRGDDVSTEDLRIVLQRYRAFFNRLLSV